MSEGEGIQNFFTRAQELYSPLQQAEERWSHAVFSAVILAGLLEQYKHFSAGVIQSIWGLNISPGETFQLFNWKKKQR